jgi:hypothetical protein
MNLDSGRPIGPPFTYERTAQAYMHDIRGQNIAFAVMMFAVLLLFGSIALFLVLAP